MSDNKPKHLILRAYNEVRVIAGKKDPSKEHGFQVCGIVKGEGRVEEFEQYFDPKKASLAARRIATSAKPAPPKVVMMARAFSTKGSAAAGFLAASSESAVRMARSAAGESGAGATPPPRWAAA